MAKRKVEKKGGVVMTVVWTLIAVLLIGGIGFGIYKLVDHFKPAEKPGEEQTEKTPEKDNEQTQTTELVIAEAALAEAGIA